MRYIAVLLALLAAWRPGYIRPEAEIEERTVTVAVVKDGDTFRGEDGIDYRLAGINAPEIAHPEHGKPTGEPGGDEAAEYLRSLIGGRTITVLIDREHPTDRYSRTVGLVLLDDLDVNVEMVASGHAEFRYVDLSPMLDEAAFRSADAKRGTDGEPIAGVEPGDTETPTAGSGHVLEAGDRVRVIVGPQSEDFTLNPEGSILVRGLGVLRLAGLTADAAAETLAASIRTKGYDISPITVFYLAPPTRQEKNVVVLGAVRRPGTVRANTLLSAISAAEGYIVEANPSEVRITRGDSSVIVDLGEIVAGLTPDLPLEGGDVVFLPTLPRILVSGGVERPGWVSAVTLSEAVSAAGGPIPEADLGRVEIRSQGAEPVVVDLQRVFSGIDDDTRLSDRDRVTVPVRPRAFVPQVAVYGPVARPGTVEGYSLADAVREAGADTSADLTRVIIDRGGETAVVNARAIVLGHAPDVELLQGDRVLIPQIAGGAGGGETPTRVVVNGDVGKPGIVSAGRLTEVVATAGGVSNTARSIVYVRYPDGSSSTYSLTSIARGNSEDPQIPDGSSVFVPTTTKATQFIRSLVAIAGVAFRAFTLSL